MNVELLLKVKEKILAEPENFDISDFECGTVRRIGGHAIVLSGKCVYQDNKDIKGSFLLYSCQLGMIALDITEKQAHKLFYAHNWPKEFFPDKNVNSSTVSAETAAKRIDHFIATKGEE